MSPRRARAVADRPGDHAAALREHLVSCAAGALHETPASLITTRSIARRAGVSDGVLYNHFHDKDDLLLAGLLRRFEEVAAEHETGLPAEGGRDLDAELEAVVEAQVAYQAALLPLLLGLVGHPPLLHRFFVAIHRHPLGPGAVRKALIERIERAQSAGRIRGDADAATAATLLMGGALQHAFAGHLGGLYEPADRPRPRSEAAAIATHLLDGLRAGEA